MPFVPVFCMAFSTAPARSAFGISFSSAAKNRYSFTVISG